MPRPAPPAPGAHVSWVRGPLGKFTWRMLAAVLGGQGICVLLGAVLARSVAATDGTGDSGIRLGLGVALGLLCFVAAGGLRRGWGLPVGWFVQALTLASALIVPMMIWVALMFLAMWIYCLRRGIQIDAMMAERAR